MQNIRNIIFDLGGVIMELHFDRTFQAFARLTGQDFREAYNQQKQQEVFDALETGRISPAEFRQRLQQMFGFTANDEQIDEAWNAMLGHFPAERVELVKQLGQQKRVFLMSNTNAIHKAKADEIFGAAFPGQKMEDLFEVAYFSHTMHDRKPHTSVFTRIVEENGLEASETLFIDDTEGHVLGARQAGLQALHLKPPVQITELEWA